MKIIVRSPNWVGDAIMCLPALQSIKENFPRAEIWIAAQNWVKEIFYNLDYITGIVPLPNITSFRIMLNSAKKIRRMQFDVGFLLPNSFASAFLFYLARIPQRWGYARDGRQFLLSRAVSIKKSDKVKHQVVYYLDLIKSLGLKVIEPKIFLKLTSTEKGWAENKLKSLNISSQGPIIGIHPGSFYGPAKRWITEKYASLASEFQRKLGATVIIFGTKEEISLAEEISSKMSFSPYIFTGQTSLRQLIALIDKCDLFLTNDSGPMHIANALGIPVAAIFGPTNPHKTAPFHPPSVVIYKAPPCGPCQYRECPTDHQCMKAIQVEEVFEACKKLIQ
ncbi:MAG: lipopolysaccharide heptosyltransferase II [Candidatus Aminicenantia bacterium]